MDFLTYHNYTVREKEVKAIKNKSGNIERHKCNLDIEMSNEMIVTVPHYDIALIVSGDGDYVTTIRRLRESGKKIWCLTERGFASKELINEVDKFIKLSSLKNKIER